MLIKLDTRLGWLNSSLISFNQLSVGTSKLEFEITENNQPKDLTDLRVMIEIKTPSGSIQEEHVTIIDAVSGKIEKDLSAPMLTEEGSHYGELSLYSQDNTKLLCTHKFRYIVGSNYGEQGAKQTSQYATLQTCIMEVKGLEKEVGNNIEEIEISKNLAEQAKNEAKQSKVESMQSASNSIQSSIAAERSAESALETSGTLDQVVEMAKQSAEASKQSAGASQASADAAERAKDVVLQSVEQSNAASKTANQASVNAEQALRDAIVSKDTAKQAEISATTSANEASKAEASANNSKAILEQKIQEIVAIKEVVDNTVSTANTAVEQANIAINAAETLTAENQNLILTAVQTTNRAEDAIANANTANQTANQKLIDTTEQANIAKEQVQLAKDEVTKAQAETTKATEQANVATLKSEEATTQANRAAEEANKAGAQAQEKVNNKIGLNGVHDDTIFNFIENKVVQDGLTVDKNYSGGKIFSNLSDCVLIQDDNFVINGGTLIITSDGTTDFDGVIGQISQASPYSVGSALSSDSSSLQITFWNASGSALKTVVLNKKFKILAISAFKRKVKIYQDGNEQEFTLSESYVGRNDGLYVGKALSGSINRPCGGKINNILFYNKQLTPQEIQHNFSVLNSTPAIKELHTTDAEGKTSILKLASDEDHVEMSTGRTLREEYMSVLKTMGKEFTSTDGSPVEANNGIEARVINAEIKGYTVKCIVSPPYDGNRNGWNDVGVFTSACYGTSISQISTSGNPCKIRRQLQSPFNLQNKYYLSATIENKTESELNTHINIYDADIISSQGITNQRVPAKSKSRISGIITLTNDKLTGGKCSIQVGAEKTMIDGEVVFSDIMVIDVTGDTQTKEYYDNTITKALPFGLNSTQAIVSNNGQQYPVYEPTIQGKTRILKAPKGTQNWVEISADEARDAATYDYKLDSVNGDLGSVSSVSDYIDRARKVKTCQTEEVVLPTSGWINYTDGTVPSGYVRYSLVIPKYGGDSNKTNILCSEIKSVSASAIYKGISEKCISINSASAIHVNLPTSEFPTKESWITYLTNNSLTVRLKLVTPQEVPLTDEEFKAYDAYKKVISLGSTPTKKDTLEIKDDGSAIYTQNTKDADDGSARIDLPAPIMTHIDKSLLPTIITQQTNTIEVGGAVKPSSFKVTVPVDRIAEQQAEIDEIKKQLGAVAALQLAQIN